MLTSGCGAVVAPADGGPEDDVRSDRPATPDVVVRDVQRADVAPDVVFEDAAAPDVAVADVAAPDVAVADVVRDGGVAPTVTVRADSICGVAVAAGGSEFAVLYGIGVGASFEVRASFVRGDGTATTLTLARHSAPLCVGRDSLSPSPTSAPNEFVGAWNSRDGLVAAAQFTSAGVTSRLTLPAGSAASFAPFNEQIAFDGRMLAVSAMRGRLPVLRLAWVGFSSGTVSMPSTGSVYSDSTLDLPPDVSSLSVSRGVAAYTRSSVDASATVRQYGIGRIAYWGPNTTVVVPGAAAMTEVLSFGGRPGETPDRVWLQTGTRNRSISTADLAGSWTVDRTLTALPVVSDGAWHQVVGIGTAIEQSANGGRGLLWAGHNGGGYNGTVTWSPQDGSRASCVSLVTTEERSSWTSFALAQRGARSKVLAAVRQMLDGGVSAHELTVRHLEDGAGICGL